MGNVLWGTMASDLAVWAAFGVTGVVLASAIMFFVKRGVGVSRAVAWASVVALVVEAASLASVLGFASSEYTVAVSDLPFIGEYAAVVVDDVDAVAGVKERGGELVVSSQGASGVANAGDRVALSVRRLPGGSGFPWYAERNTKTGGGWKAGYKLDGVDGFVVYSGACASVGPDGCKVTYRDVFGGGEGFYLVQVQPVSGDAESQ